MIIRDYNYENHEETLNDILENGVVCSLRMRFECTVMSALSTKGKTSTSLQEEIKLGDIDNNGFNKTHKWNATFCILNDVVVVSS